MNQYGNVSYCVLSGKHARHSTTNILYKIQQTQVEIVLVVSHPRHDSTHLLEEVLDFSLLLDILHHVDEMN